jgi:hypothetical protein
MGTVLVALAEVLTDEIAHANRPLIHEIDEAIQAIGAANEVPCRIELSALQNVPTFAVFPVDLVAVPLVCDQSGSLVSSP